MDKFTLPPHTDMRVNFEFLLIHYLCKEMKYTSAFEIGIMRGDTLSVLMNVCDTVLAIDVDTDNLYPDLKQQIERDENFNILKISSSDFIPSGHWDFINVDGKHTYENAANDLNIAKQMMSSNGTIMVDDVWAWKSIDQALQDFLSSNTDFVPFLADEQSVYIHHCSSNKTDFLDNTLMQIFEKFCTIEDIEYAGFTIPRLTCWPAITNDNEVFNLIVKNNNF